ncbi:MAG: Lrp/AsnC family transcriptional regulator [Cognaticolwellia sp.]
MSNYTCLPNNVLSPLERQYVLLTQSGLPIVAQPYQVIAEQLEISVADVLAMTLDLKERGIIRRIAAVPNHYKLGYRFNGMTVWDVEDSSVSEYGKAIGQLPFVSHCYLRPRHLPRWNYNLFAMVHGKTEHEVQQYRTQIKDLLINVLQARNDDPDHKGKFQTNDMLTSTEILKKTGLRLKR